MATKPDTFPALAMKRAASQEVAALFSQLAKRASTLAQMQDEFLQKIVRHREARTGKVFHHTKRQQKLLDEFDSDAEKAKEDVQHYVQKMDDAALLSSAISTERMELNLDENMLSTHRAEDREYANQIVLFRRETVRLIESFVEASKFKGKVNSQWIDIPQAKHA